MSDQDIDRIADMLADRLESRCSVCTLSYEEQEEIRGLLKTKKSSVRVLLWLMGALAVWILKDVYIWVASHLAFR